VVAADNLLTGRLANIQHLRNDSRFEFLEKGRQLPPSNVAPWTMCFTLPVQPAGRLRGARHRNITSGLLRHIRGPRHRAPIQRQVHDASTSECYGDPLVHPQTECYWGHVNPIGPRSVYDEAKRFSEAVTMATTAITR